MERQPARIKRAPRIDMRRSATLINSDGYESRAIILDVSSGGFRLEVEESPRIGEFVKLRVERDQEFPAQIRWALGNEAGGVFLAPVDYADLSMGTGGTTMTSENIEQDGQQPQAEDRRNSDRRTQGERRNSDRTTTDRRQEDRRGGDDGG